MSEEKPKYSRGRKMNIPDGTGFGIVGMMSGERYLMSRVDALKAENIIKMFETIKAAKPRPRKSRTSDHLKRGPPSLN